MKSTSPKIYWSLLPIALLVFVDEWLKYRGLQTLPAEGGPLRSSLLDFVIHKNYGIAFDIPFRLGIIIAISLVIGVVLIDMAWKNRVTHPRITFSAIVILLGAAGNLYDRLAYGFTVDYILLFARSAINLSDVVILLGVVSLLMNSRKKNQTGDPDFHAMHS